MKITIIGSSAFRKEMVEYMEKLEEMGYEPIVHPHYVQSIREGRTDIMDRIAKGEHAQLKKENDYIMWYHDAIVGSDAVLVMNFEKREIANYVGGNTLMEIGFAYVNHKKIYLVNPIPTEVSYKDEIIAMDPVVINGDLSKII